VGVFSEHSVVLHIFMHYENNTARIKVMMANNVIVIRYQFLIAMLMCSSCAMETGHSCQNRIYSHISQSVQQKSS